MKESLIVCDKIFVMSGISVCVPKQTDTKEANSRQGKGLPEKSEPLSGMILYSVKRVNDKLMPSHTTHLLTSQHLSVHTNTSVLLQKCTCVSKVK